ncbi:hypothetical protein SAMN05421869_127129 [Nonomuraea jiangxiensis]|uniref:Uncharacterized protein n=1 Tax=Nonomuraea jiangxiensis TaxID=633440 RepID=A0A1G9L940_9ACTN|nr:hypothetical protein SAMN05421869_127129 [Nonomuraea jiangxiensis]
MAFSHDKSLNDKGRHRRGRWWQRGSYLFSRRNEAPPDAERSFWSDARERPPEARPGASGLRQTERPGRSGSDGLRGRPEGVTWPGAGAQAGFGRPREATSGRPQGYRAQDTSREVTWDGYALRGQPERLPAAVVERPRYTWYDFELDDQPPRAQPNRPDAPSMGDGLRHCGRLERILHRQWDARQGPPSADVVRAVESLARLPERLKDLLAEGLEGIYVGGGGVPDLDDMGYLRGAPLPSGRATWDICAGAYGDGKIVVGDRPSPTPDVMMHEVGHAIDDIDAAYGEWVSDSPEFTNLYDRALPLLTSMFHRQGGGLGRKEFFADAFAAIAARQRPALVDMLGGNTRMALDVMLFFNRRYGI